MKALKGLVTPRLNVMNPLDAEELEHQRHVVRLLMEHRGSLFAFIFTCMRDYSAAEDVLQELAVAICEHGHEFTIGTNFQAWAREIARRRIAAYWRTVRRHEQSLSEAQLQQISSGFEHVSHGNKEMHIKSIRYCLSRLSPFVRELFKLRYDQQLSLEGIAEAVERKPESIRKAMYRGRQVLRECVERRMANLNGGVDLL